MTEKGAPRRGLMLILSSPSGAGKTTLSRQLLELEDELEMSVSVTTRPKRPGETDGVDYIFVGEDEFAAMVGDDQLLEHATVFGNSYGTPRGPVEAALSRGCDVIFDIDWQGTQELEQSMGSDVVRIFVLPPSLKELERRLRKRGQDSEDVVRSRMARATDEIGHWAEYDYVLINTDFETCLGEIRAILRSERMRRSRQAHLTEFVRDLMGES